MEVSSLLKIPMAMIRENTLSKFSNTMITILIELKKKSILRI